MKVNKPIQASVLAFILATSCCWLPALIIAIGGGSTLLAFSNRLESNSGIFLSIGFGLLAYGIYSYRKKKTSTSPSGSVELQSILTCPECGRVKEETMPTDACQYFYECEQCQKLLKPLQGDCCVFCSYGTVDCPPIQLNQQCC